MIAKNVWSHFERIKAASGEDASANFFQQLNAVYSTVAIGDIAEYLSLTKVVKLSIAEVQMAFNDSLPNGNLAHVMRIHDFHRGGLLPPSKAGKLQTYMHAQTTTRQPHGSAYAELSVAGEFNKVATHNSTVKVDRPLFQRGWEFKTDAMPEFVDMRIMNRQHFECLPQFLSVIGCPVESGE